MWTLVSDPLPTWQGNVVGSAVDEPAACASGMVWWWTRQGEQRQQAASTSAASKGCQCQGRAVSGDFTCGSASWA
ncbi:predicted protein [Pyrenophora tritici-repentis Pt-1C-BFP]|uniref:Uncharacterized protein n=1 Tax=Pyrenophora tritici-repentis (strain Pt-1C-BFP) TaxID=426418 RepID=B2VXD5_PYRTR|nr:uncharacterized protein PTRG_03181 [Pyrenophora tritici-repentis Pt-1C-BFP]EDU45704.1 predicted protein [Pyrenophora tritici-repentis Pt-1C-BFP]